jgi:uncharacterized repeat protein (TIGR01451 family)
MYKNFALPFYFLEAKKAITFTLACLLFFAGALKAQDIAVHITGPASVMAGGTVTYTIIVSNYGPSAVTDINLSAPVVTGLSVTGISSCTASTGAPGTASCPASSTVAALQAGTLIIPSLPNASNVTFTVTSTATGAASSSISYTASASLSSGTDPAPANNSNTITTVIINSCIATNPAAVYTLNAASTASANAIAANGGTANLVYTLTSGVAVPGIGASFTIPFTYSKLNSLTGTSNLWNGGVVVTIPGLPPYYSLNVQALQSPSYTTPPVSGDIYFNLPLSNRNQSFYPEEFFTNHLTDGTISQLGTYSLTLGNYPAAPAGYIVTDDSLIFREDVDEDTYNNAMGSATSAFAFTFIDAPNNEKTLASSLFSAKYGNKYTGLYTAYSGISGVGNIYAPEVGGLPSGPAIYDGTVTYSINTGCSLPLTLINFTAIKQGNSSLLNWQTASEIDTKDFIIERSTNGNGYAQIGVVAASTNSSVEHNYNFTDNNPAAGVNYYRLKMEDINGDFTYSPIQIVNFNESNTMLVYPNPATDNITITGLQAGLQLRMIGVDGRILTTKITTGNTENINVQQLATGIYIIQAFKDGAAANTVKFSKN